MPEQDIFDEIKTSNWKTQNEINLKQVNHHPPFPGFTHENSFKANQKVERFNIHQQIMTVHRAENRPLTDREVKNILGYEDMNKIRPRTTELIQQGQLIEAGSVRDSKTGVMVRLVKIRG